MKPTTLSLRSVVGMVENLGIGIGITGQPFCCCLWYSCINGLVRTCHRISEDTTSHAFLMTFHILSLVILLGKSLSDRDSSIASRGGVKVSWWSHDLRSHSLSGHLAAKSTRMSRCCGRIHGKKNRETPWNTSFRWQLVVESSMSKGFWDWLNDFEWFWMDIRWS